MAPTNGTNTAHQLPWWKTRKVWWVLVIVAVLAGLIVFAIDKAGKPAPTSYGTFLDQLDADNIANVTFQGMEINGRFKHPLDTAQQYIFSSRVPDFGDPSLIAELRKQHVVIDVSSPSQWSSMLGGLPWPMLLFMGAALIAGLVRLIRGEKAGSGSAMPMHPMQGMMGLVSGLFKKQQSPNPPEHNGAAKHDGDDAKSR
jgi:ATP-dependent Zn protease